MQRYHIEIETEYGRGIYDGDEYHELVSKKDDSGEWCKYDDVKTMVSRIERMQNRIDKLEGRM